MTKDKIKDEGHLTQNVLDAKFSHLKCSYCFFGYSIDVNDSDIDAETIRNQAMEMHEQNKLKKFKLIDEKNDEITYFGIGTFANNYMKVVNLKEDFDDKIKKSMNIMSSSENRGKVWFFKHKYDWAWIKGAIDENLILGCSKLRFISEDRFIDYIELQKKKKKPSKAVLIRYNRKITSETFPWTYEDEFDDSLEVERRNAIVLQFIKLMNS